MKHLYNIALFLLITLAAPIAGFTQNDSIYHPGSIQSGDTILCSTVETITIQNLLLPDTGSVIINEREGDFLFRWKRNSDTLPNSNNKNYTVTLDELSPNQEYIYTRESRLCDTCFWYSDSGEFKIKVVELPSVQISIATDSLCAGSQTVLTALTTTNCTFLWSTNATSQQITVSNTGSNARYTYSVTASHAEASGCSASDTASITMLPSFDAGEIASDSSTFCINMSDNITINNSIFATGGDGNISYRWKCNNVVIDGSENSLTVSIENLPVGTHIFTRETKDNRCNTGWTASEGQYIIVISDLPNAQIISSSDTLCEGENAILTATGGNNYAWSTTAQTPSISVSNAGTYSVTVTNSYGCTATASATVYVLPTFIPGSIVTQHDTICGETTITINNSTSAAGGDGNISYRWKRNNVVINGSNSSLTVSTNTLPAGTHIFTREAKDNRCNTSWTASEGQYLITIADVPDAQIISSSDTLCAGETATLTATGGNNFAWSTTAGTPSISVSNAGTYSVTVTNSYGCTATASATVNVLQTFNPGSINSGEVSLCAGENVSIVITENNSAEGGDNQISYRWKRNNIVMDSFTGASLTIQSNTLTAGTYIFIRETKDNRCNTGWTASEGQFEATIFPKVISETCHIISKRNTAGLPYMLVYPQAGLLYQWYKDNDIIEGATKQYYCPENGLEKNTCYAVKVIANETDQCGLFTDCWYMPDNKNENISIIPNPNDGSFSVRIPQSAIYVRIFSTSGQQIYTYSLNGEEQLSLNSGLSNGLYLLQVTLTDGSIITEKLIIKK